MNYLHNCVIRARTLKVSFLIWEKITPDGDLCVWKHSQELVCGLRPSKKIFNFKLDIGARARGCSKYAWWIDLLFLFQNTIASCSTFEEVEIKYKKKFPPRTRKIYTQDHWHFCPRLKLFVKPLLPSTVPLLPPSPLPSYKEKENSSLVPVNGTVLHILKELGSKTWLYWSVATLQFLSCFLHQEDIYFWIHIS